MAALFSSPNILINVSNLFCLSKRRHIYISLERSQVCHFPALPSTRIYYIKMYGDSGDLISCLHLYFICFSNFLDLMQFKPRRDNAGNVTSCIIHTLVALTLNQWPCAAVWVAQISALKSHSSISPRVSRP